eukprot:jgi/Mesvir1/21038/Mv08086-RA.1
MEIPVDVENDAFCAELDAVMQREEAAAAARRRQPPVDGSARVPRETSAGVQIVARNSPGVSPMPAYSHLNQQSVLPELNNRQSSGEPKGGQFQQPYQQQEWPPPHVHGSQGQAGHHSPQQLRPLSQHSESPQMLSSSQQQQPQMTAEGVGSTLAKKYKVVIHFASKDRLEASMAPYAERLIGHFKAVGGWYIHTSKRWSFPIGRLQELEARLKKDNVTVEGLPPFVRRAIDKLSHCSDDTALYQSIPPALEQKLFPFQREGVKFILRRGGRGLIGDEMGLGKTLQAIALLSCYASELPALIMVPSSLRLQWSHELQESLGVPASDVWVVWSMQDADLGGVYNIVSYDFVPKLEDAIRNKNFQVVIADESHYLKNHKAQRSRCSVPALQRARRAILLTGTPSPSRPAELFQQLSALHRACFGNFAVFAERFCAGGKFGFATGSSNLPELHALLETYLMVRRLKKDVLTQLPDKRRQKVLLQVSPRELEPCTKLLQQIDAVRGALEASADTSELGLLRAKHENLVNQLYVATADAKAGAVQAYLADLLESNTKFLVFGLHKGLMDAMEVTIAKHLGPLQQKYIRVDGHTQGGDRQGLVDQFQKNESTRVAILSIRAAGVGINLTAASTVVFAEYAWNPGDILQAEDRAHRIGQKDSVNIYFLHVNGTADDMLWNTLQAKLANVTGALDGSANDSHLKLEETSLAPPRQLAGQGTLESWRQPLVLHNTKTSPSGPGAPMVGARQPDTLAGTKRKLSMGDEGKGADGPMDRFLQRGPSQ